MWNMLATILATAAIAFIGLAAYGFKIRREKSRPSRGPGENSKAEIRENVVAVVKRET